MLPVVWLGDMTRLAELGGWTAKLSLARQQDAELVERAMETETEREREMGVSINGVSQ